MSKKIFRKACLVLVATVVFLPILSSCGTETKVGEKQVTKEELKTCGYPIPGENKLTIWLRGAIGPVSNGNTDYDNYPRELERNEKTGVTLETTYATTGQDVQQFNLLLASGDLPDMIWYKWDRYPGGVEKAVQDKYILALNEYLPDYAPNFYNLLQSNDELDRLFKTDSGNYCLIGGIDPQYRERTIGSGGYIVRKDWLDELGLPLPETVSEWYSTMKAVKEAKNLNTVLTYPSGDPVYYTDLMGAWGIGPNSHREGEKVVYGRITSAYKDYLTEMNKWYQEGLLDPDIANIDSKTVTAKIVNGSAFATYGWVGSSLGTWQEAGVEYDTNFELAGVKPPVVNKGERSKINTLGLPASGEGIAITTNCKNPELALKFLDYGFTEEGSLQLTFGTEGESWDMIDGFPTFKEEILHPSSGIALAESLTLYSYATGGWPMKSRQEYTEQYYNTPQKLEAAKNFGQTDSLNYVLPLLYPTEEESAELSKIQNDISTYADEMMMKFILGQEPLSNFDAYVEQMKNLGVDKMVNIQQAALERYFAR